MVHDLKTWPEDFDAIAEGRKRHEVRSTADRKFAVDDDLRLLPRGPLLVAWGTPREDLPPDMQDFFTKLEREGALTTWRGP